MKFLNSARFAIKLLLFFAILVGVLLTLSMAAVTLWYINYNAPIVTLCPVSEGSSTIAAVDPDGMVTRAVINEGAQPELTLSEPTAATSEGGMFTAQLNVYDTLEEGRHRFSVIFVNNNTPIPQTAVCRMMVNVTHGRDESGVARTFYTVVNRSNTRAMDDVTELVRRVPLGMLPGLIVVGIAFFAGARFTQGVYGLDTWREGLSFLSSRVFGRANKKSPSVKIRPDGSISGDGVLKHAGGPGWIKIRNDCHHAVVLEQAGKLSRVLLPPFFNVLEPFEKVKDVVDLRPQNWADSVAAITRDGIVVTYRAEIQFQVGRLDENGVFQPPTEEEIFKAFTSTWIRDANRSEPDRLMTWPKRVIIGTLSGAFRSLLEKQRMDDLLNPECWTQVRADLKAKLTASVAGYGVVIHDVTLGNVKYNDKALSQWFEEWQARRDAEVQKVLVEGRAKRISMREKAQNSLRRRLIKRTSSILKKQAQRDHLPLDQISETYVLMSFIEMIRNASSETPAYLTGYFEGTFDRLQERLHRVHALEGPPEDDTEPT